MVQVIKRTKIRGEIFENRMSFTDQEWALLQQHYPNGGVSFHPIVKEEKKATKGRDKDDDKPLMKDYNTLKDRGMEYFKAEDWDKALYYLELAYELKSHAWLMGKITNCKQYGRADKIAKGKA